MGFILDSLRQDVHYGIRQLAARPEFLLLSVLALAIGIGATSSIFSAVYAVLLRPLPFRDPDRLVTLWESDLRRSRQEVEISYQNFLAWRKQNAVFEDIAAISSVNLDFAITSSREPQQVEGTIVSAGFFPLLGARPLMGRTFTSKDARPGAPAVAAISHRLWERIFGHDPGVAGRTIQVDGEAATIVGVMPTEFDFPKDVDIWFPLDAAAIGLEKQPNLRILRAVARLKPGVTVEKARNGMEVVARRLESQYQESNRGYGVLIIPMAETVFGATRPALLLLFGAALLVLLIGCANVANLLLARATSRQREMAVRAAIGASRTRLVSQLLTESVVMALAGGLAGLVLADFGVSLLAALAPSGIPRVESIAVNGRVVWFTILLSLATVVLFGLAPALHAAKANLHDALKESSARSSGSGGRLRNVLVVGEMAVSVVLLAGAGLLIRSLHNLQSIDPGFRTENILTFRITLGQTRYESQEARRNFYRQLLRRLRALPGVRSTAAVLLRPLSGKVGWDNAFTIEGQTLLDQASNPTANYEAISPDYFKTMGISLLAGRDFESATWTTPPE